MNTKAKESRRLAWAKQRLEELGYYVMLSRASLGPFDLLAVNELGIRCIQVKCNANPDAAERETIQLFCRLPENATKEVWRFNDGDVAPEITVL